MTRLLAIVTERLRTVCCNMAKAFAAVALYILHISSFIFPLCFLGHMNGIIDSSLLCHGCLSELLLFLVMKLTQANIQRRNRFAVQ